MQELLDRIQKENDQAAFRELYLLYAPELLTFAYTYAKSKFVSEEVTNDVFMSIWKNRARIHEIRNLKVYLYRAVKNAVINYFTRNKDWQFVDIEEVADTHLRFTTDPEKIMITAELRKKIESTIASLPQRCQLIFKMIKEDNLKYKEVAEILDITVKTVENQMTIAIKKINSVLKFDVSGSGKEAGLDNNKKLLNN